MRGVRLAVATSVVLLGVATPVAAVDPPELEKAYTEHLGQLVTAPGKGGVNELNNRANGTLGMPGTDLGVSFESRGRDRKSTRLNSSHVAISYAVFCLKTKKAKPR